MESKHPAVHAVPTAWHGGVLPPVPAVPQSPRTGTSGPSLPSLAPVLARGRTSPPLRLPAPRPPVEDAERVVCSLPSARVGSAPVLRDRVRRGPDHHRSLELLASPALPTVLRGLPDAQRRELRDRLLSCLIDRDAGLRPVDLARHTASLVRACGGDVMASDDFQAFQRLLAQAPGELGTAMVCALLDGLCAGLGLDEASEPALAEALVQALCQGVGLLEDPMDAELVMRRLAQAAGGPRMGPGMRTRLVDALLDEPDLPVEALGCMLLGLAVAFEAPAPASHLAAGSRAATAGGEAARTPSLPCLSSLLAASLELSEPQLARWGQAVGVALRHEGEEGLAEIEETLREMGALLEPGCLTALACGLGSGLADGCPDGGARLTLESLLARATEVPLLGPRMALRRGLRLAADPVGATVGWDDRVAWLQAAWRLPGVVNARTAPRWFAQALALDEPAVERVHVLETLVIHGAMHLGDDAIRQARDLALAADPAAVPGIYGAWIESGLPVGLFDDTLPPDEGWPVERHLLARRLALVEQELQALPEMPCDAYLRSRLRGLLTGWRKDLAGALAAADGAGQAGTGAATKVETKAATKAGLSASPAAR